MLSFVENSQFQRQRDYGFTFCSCIAYVVKSRSAAITSYYAECGVIGSLFLSRPCEASHKINESWLYTFVLTEQAIRSRCRKSYNNRMKKLFYALMLVLGMNMLVSCQKEGNDSDSIVGTWIRVTEEWEEEGEHHFFYYDDDEGYYHFKENGKALFFEPHNDLSLSTDRDWLTWTLSDDILTLTNYEGEIVLWQISFTKDRLVVIWEEGSITTFRRASNREIKQYLKYL